MKRLYKKIPTVFILLLTFMFGCRPQSTSTEIISPTSIASCFPDSVFTAEEMRARVDCHPADYKMEINSDTVVLFAFPDPLLDWVGPIFVIHIPSVSEVVLDRDGTVLFEGYKSLEGETEIEQVLNDPELISRILKQAK